MSDLELHALRTRLDGVERINGELSHQLARLIQHVNRIEESLLIVYWGCAWLPKHMQGPEGRRQWDPPPDLPSRSTKRPSHLKLV